MYIHIKEFNWWYRTHRMMLLPEAISYKLKRSVSGMVANELLVGVSWRTLKVLNNMKYCHCLWLPTGT